MGGYARRGINFDKECSNERGNNETMGIETFEQLDNSYQLGLLSEEQAAEIKTILCERRADPFPFGAPLDAEQVCAPVSPLDANGQPADTMGPAKPGGQRISMEELRYQGSPDQFLDGLAAVKSGSGAGGLAFATSQALGASDEDSMKHARAAGAAGNLATVGGRGNAPGGGRGPTGTGPVGGR